MLGVVLLAGSLLSVWPGCKDGSTDSSSASRGNPGGVRPLALEALPLTNHTGVMDNPVISSAWKNAQWYTLAKTPSGRSGNVRTKVATEFSKSDLYVAIISTGPYHCDSAAAADNLWRHDCTEIWLDTSRRQNGTNFFELVVSPSGRTHGVWHRSSTPPTPNANGSPNFNHPYGLIPFTISGLMVKTGSATWRGQPAVTTIVKIPLASLPAPLQFAGKIGGRFRVNVLRYLWRATDGGRRKVTQYSLFPVPPETQAFAPYLMGRLALISSDDASLALRR
jgi:hypothetical protein